jgi:hypothetical protein
MNEKLMRKALLKFNKYLKGKTIERVSFLGDEDMDDMGWSSRPVVITFTDGSIIIPQSDDEGNDGGSIFYQDISNQDIIHTTY